LARRSFNLVQLIVWVRIPPGTLSETVEQTDSPPVLLRNELTTADRTIVRPACLGRHGMVTAPRGRPSNAYLALRVSVLRAVMVWSPVPDAPPAPPPPPPPPLQPYTTTARGRHTSGSPIVEEPRLVLHACKAAAPRESGTRRDDSRSRQRTTLRSRPGLVTISFENERVV